MSAPIDVDKDRKDLPDIVAQNPVFELEFDMKSDHNIDMNEFEMYKLKKIFAIADLTHVGVIGPKQFKELMVCRAASRRRLISSPTVLISCESCSVPSPRPRRSAHAPTSCAADEAPDVRW